MKRYEREFDKYKYEIDNLFEGEIYLDEIEIKIIKWLRKAGIKYILSLIFSHFS